jgi:hypothetical protein
MSTPLFPPLAGLFPVNTVINDLYAIALKNHLQGRSAAAKSHSLQQLGITSVELIDEARSTSTAVFMPEVATIATLRAGFFARNVLWEFSFIVSEGTGSNAHAGAASLSAPRSSASSSAAASSALDSSPSATLSLAPARAVARRVRSPADSGANAGSMPPPPQIVPKSTSAAVPPIAAAEYPRILALDGEVWVKDPESKKPVWMLGRVTSLPFNRLLSTKHSDNKIHVQAFIWLGRHKTWTMAFEPTSDSIRMRHEISEAQAFAALPPNMPHLVEKLAESIAFSRQWKAHVEIDERRGRTELRAGMEVGFQAPGQGLKREVSR